MKAIYFEQHGGLEELRYGDVPEPVAGTGDVLIRVKACALNYLDIWVRRGWPDLKLALPHWGGSDIAGDVVSVGPDVHGWQTGQRVIVDPGINLANDEYTRTGQDSLSPNYRIIGEMTKGGAAERVIVPAKNLMPMPMGMDYPLAAAALLVGLTAWRMLIHRARLRAGESVLVVGAGGGVNTMAIQIAKLAGAVVYVVASNKEKAALAEDLGADIVIDRSETDWEEEISILTGKRGVDVVVDNVGRATLHKSLKAASRGGRIVMVGNTSGPRAEIDIRYIFGKQLEIIGSTMGSHQDFHEITTLLGVEKLKPVIDCVMPLSEGIRAYERLEKGKHFGKIVLAP